MQVLRFVGKDNRSALEQVRAHLGPEALILSNKRTPRGIEICATGELPDLQQASPVSDGQSELQLAQLKRELMSLRETLQAALGQRRWQDTEEHRPVASTIAQRLATLGIGRVLAGDLTANISSGTTLPNAWNAVMAHLTERMTHLGRDEVAALRIKAIVGTSGAGKTHLAAAYVKAAVARHGASQVVTIVLGEPKRAGVLQAACTATGVKALKVENHTALVKALDQCRWAKEVIIDTPALLLSQGADDPVLAALSRQRAGFAVILALPATVQGDYLLKTIEHAGTLPLAGAVITKLDEATQGGGVVDALALQHLAIAGLYNPDGERIGELTAAELLAECKRLARDQLQRQSAMLKVAV